METFPKNCKTKVFCTYRSYIGYGAYDVNEAEDQVNEWIAEHPECSIYQISPFTHYRILDSNLSSQPIPATAILLVYAED